MLFSVWQATEFLYRDKFNDTGASGEFNLMSEPDNDINIKFNSEDFLNEVSLLKISSMSFLLLAFCFQRNCLTVSATGCSDPSSG